MNKRETVELKPLKLKDITITIVGDTELITHAWSEKAKKQILEKQQKKKSAKDIRDPQAEYESGFYHFPGGGYGFPAIGLKCAITNVAHKDIGIEKTLVRKSVYIKGTPDKQGMQLVKIEGSEPTMREDMVTIGAGTSDLRYRPQFSPWYMTIGVRFNEDFITAETVINLFNLAGFGSGLGEWRPEKNGQSGMFHVADEAELKALSNGQKKVKAGA